MKVHHLLMGFLVSAILIGVAWGDIDEDTKYIYNMDQSVQGNGFFNSYQDLTASELSLTALDHGSGKYRGESEYHVQNQAIYVDIIDYDFSDLQTLKFNRSTDYAYAPTNFDFGRSFRAAAFQSKGQEGVCIKNYAFGDRSNIKGISMNALFRDLDVLSSNTSAGLSFIRTSVEDDDNYDLVSFNSSGSIMLNLESAFAGRGHIGVLGALNATGRRHIGVPDIEIDEDYIGKFSLSKKMSQAFIHNWNRDYDEWLPCCSGGFADMNYVDKKIWKSATGVFDCTCFKAPTQAQFQRVY